MIEVNNLRILVAFDGSGYSGWQKQKKRPTIQGILLSAIEKITGETVNLIGCGRTDAGVHARGLVANFKSRTRLEPAQMARALNAVLPKDIRILRARRAPLGFHARIDALSKTYRYQIYRGPVMPPHLAGEYYHYPFPLDLPAVEAAAELFIGEHDFAGFAAYSGRRSRRGAAVGLDGRDAGTRRRMIRCDLRRRGHRLFFTVEGEGFLHHMIRNMVGTLLELGRGKMTIDEFRALFELRDRTLAGFTAPAHGLILIRVRYPA
jgi:tRNA pseudouridine38-40 synthase